MIPIEDDKWHDLAEHGSKTKLPPRHRIEYARVLNGGDGIKVRITGPNAYVWGACEAGREALGEAVDRALEWFRSVGGEL